jgi:hypothetical protein
MLPLGDPLWNELSPDSLDGAYPGAATFPALLQKLAAAIHAGEYTRDLLVELDPMCHQWSTYDSTLAAVPHLIRICGNRPPDELARIDLLSWVGWCVACVHLNRQHGPEKLKHWYNDAVPVARTLIAQSLPFAKDPIGEHRNVRELLAAFAACNGNYGLAFILYELEAGGFKCDHCNQFIQPMESSMNPLWLEGKGS